MQADQLSHERQANSHPGMWPAATGVGLPEHLKDMRQKLRFNTRARVFNNQSGPPLVSLETYTDSSARERELHGIVEQVPNYLFQAQWISIDKDNLFRGVNCDFDLL